MYGDTGDILSGNSGDRDQYWCVGGGGGRSAVQISGVDMVVAGGGGAAGTLSINQWEQ